MQPEPFFKDLWSRSHFFLSLDPESFIIVTEAGAVLNLAGSTTLDLECGTMLDQASGVTNGPRLCGKRSDIGMLQHLKAFSCIMKQQSCNSLLRHHIHTRSDKFICKVRFAPIRTINGLFNWLRPTLSIRQKKLHAPPSVQLAILEV